jgi:hypothetical protein
VEALVSVGFGHGDVILETPVQGFPQAVNHTQERIAGFDTVADDPDAEKIVNIRRGFFPFPYFLIYRIEVFGPAGHFYADAHRVRFTLYIVLDFVKKFPAFPPFFGHNIFDLEVCLAVELLEGKILKLVFDPRNAQPSCQRGVDIQALLGGLFPFFSRPVAGFPHGPELVRQFDEYNPYILDHGKKHFTDVFRFLEGFVFCLEPRDPGSTFCEKGSVFSELLFNTGSGVLFQAVQNQGGCKGVRIEAQVRKDRSGPFGTGSAAVAAGPGKGSKDPFPVFFIEGRYFFFKYCDFVIPL